MYRDVDRVKKSGNFIDACLLIDVLAERLWYTEDDLEYKNAILEGWWPSSVDQLERALDKARKIDFDRKKGEYA